MASSIPATGALGAARSPLHVDAYPEVLAGVDLTGTCAEIDSILRRHGARTQATPVVMRVRYARPMRAIASFVLESDRIARAVVSHIRVAPVFAGIALVVHPRPELDAPLLVADLVIAPPGFARAYVDACGPSITQPNFSSRFGEPLAAVLDGARHLRKSTLPAWMAPLSGGGGGRVRARPGRGATVARVLVEYLDRYLDALDRADATADREANLASTGAVREAVRAHGPAARHLSRAFGAQFAEEYLALLWRA